jgi:hypothetical protein
VALWMVGVYVNYSIGTLQQFSVRLAKWPNGVEGKIRMSPNKRPSRQGCFWVGAKSPSHVSTLWRSGNVIWPGIALRPSHDMHSRLK